MFDFSRVKNNNLLVELFIQIPSFSNTKVFLVHIYFSVILHF